MLGTCILLQLLISYGQNKKKGKPRMLKDTLLVMTGLKAGVDAFRVASGAEMQENEAVDAVTELMGTKMVELFAESIPGCVLQVYVYLKSPETRTFKALASIIISAATAGFTSATITFDFDVSPSRRRETPEFYGFVPDGAARTLIFCCMIVNSMLLLLIKSFCCALLMLTNKSYLSWYIAGDMGVYLLQKILRGDFQYWIPVDGFIGFLASLVFRVMAKVIVDFTGSAMFRHPGELGGAYWTFSMVLALVSLFVVIEVHFSSSELMEVEVMKKEEVGKLAWVMCSAWLISFVLFLRLMKQEYLHSFFSLKDGKSVVMERFLIDDEQVKASIFKKNRKLWVGIEEEVKVWVTANWRRWNREKPKWFTKGLIAKIPKEWVAGIAGIGYGGARGARNGGGGVDSSVFSEKFSGSGSNSDSSSAQIRGWLTAGLTKSTGATVVPMEGGEVSSIETGTPTDRLYTGSGATTSLR
jgi:hypothetical protein